MPGIRLFSGNRLEVLIDELAEIFRKPLRSPLHKEIVVVQSKGMERWVSMGLARHLGICANTGFPFPNALLDEMCSRVLGNLPPSSPFDPTILVWKILRVLPECIQEPPFEPLRNYLQGDQLELKRFQLAQRIANLFDQYLVFRPDMVLAWDRGEDRGGGWQPLLWRALTRDCQVPHRARLHQTFVERLQRGRLDIASLPERIAVFGIASLPPFHLKVLSALADHIDVNLFLMNPCQEYWADIRSKRETGRILARVSSGSGAHPEALHLETGNSLLAGLGALGRDFFQLVHEVVAENRDLFVEPGEETLLACLQTDILHLVERTRAERRPISPDDRSLMVQSCHSPMREVEVLYDQLLALFEADPELAPRDILVMTPDINAYAPYIHAVFAAPEDPRLRIPYSIADRSLRREGHIGEALLAILGLPDSRLEVSHLLNVLEMSPIRRRLALTDDDLQQIRGWLAATRIRWGVDADHRERLGFGGFPQNTWKAGLQRLLLGYAMPGRGERTFAGILPYDDIEGSSAPVLGALLEFCGSLFSTAASLGRPRPLAQWAEELDRILNIFLDASSDAEREMQTVRQAIRDLAAKQEGSGFVDDVGIEVVRAHLTQKLESDVLGTGFISGGVTFCAMLPMRSIPCKVIALIGMDDGAFPRQDRPAGFDLMTGEPRRGDRSRRNDDRYLFLEALLSARKTLYVSYVGQSLQDNSAMPPSVLVSELLDVIERGYEMPGKKILDCLVTKHRLHPFSPHYFQGSSGPETAAKLFSYSWENLQASRGLQGIRQPPRPFLDAPLPEPEDEWRTVDLDQLCRFFAHPVKFLLRQRLQIALDEGEDALDDREAFDLDGLERYRVREHLLHRLLTNQNVDVALELERASGRLPHGQIGECRFQSISREVNAFYLDIARHLSRRTLEPVGLELDLGRFRLLGHLDGLTENGLVRFRAARANARDRLHLWIRHLALNAVDLSPVPRQSILAGVDGSWQFEPVPQAREHLNQLLEIYWDGLCRPLRLFPQLSYDYACARREGKSADYAVAVARRNWQGSRAGDHQRRGEGDDPYLDLCFAV
ncbi:MAG TPA: exodeoxyribonuclease V subunit gamma, partial [Syntrophobacteraceae bacterium]|nr:exodeoxyribonuclease V subunit gamma [Syntrophobacteraceae bacterium]